MSQFEINYPFYDAAIEFVHGGAFGMLNRGDNLIYDLIYDLQDNVLAEIDPDLLVREKEHKELKEDEPDFQINYSTSAYDLREQVIAIVESYGPTHAQYKEEIEERIMALLPETLVATQIHSPWLDRVRFSPSNFRVYRDQACRS